jgi:protein arginine kinase activator
MYYIKPGLCMRCKESFATVRITKIFNGEIKELHLCQACASELSPYQKKMSKLQHDINEILSGLIKQETGTKPAPKKSKKNKINLSCSNCGFRYEDYRETFFLGCSHCYISFKKYILNDIRKLHGSTKHIGHIPRRYRKIMEIKRNLDQLKRELKDAVRTENFEKAAKLRDEIRSRSDRDSPIIV